MGVPEGQGEGKAPQLFLLPGFNYVPFTLPLHLTLGA